MAGEGRGQKAARRGLGYIQLAWETPDAWPDGGPTLKIRPCASIRTEKLIYATVGVPDAPTPLKSGGGDDVAESGGPVPRAAGAYRW